MLSTIVLGTPNSLVVPWLLDDTLGYKIFIIHASLYDVILVKRNFVKSRQNNSNNIYSLKLNNDPNPIADRQWLHPPVYCYCPIQLHDFKQRPVDCGHIIISYSYY